MWPKLQSFASSFFLVLQAKYYQNWLFHGAIQKSIATRFYGPRCTNARCYVVTLEFTAITGRHLSPYSEI